VAFTAFSASAVSSQCCVLLLTLSSYMYLFHSFELIGLSVLHIRRLIYINLFITIHQHLEMLGFLEVTNLPYRHANRGEACINCKHT